MLYTARGASGLPKERLELHGGGASAVNDDFRSTVIHIGKRTIRVRRAGKGHTEELGDFLHVLLCGERPPESLSVLASVMRATFACSDDRSEPHGRT